MMRKICQKLRTTTFEVLLHHYFQYYTKFSILVKWECMYLKVWNVVEEEQVVASDG